MMLNEIIGKLEAAQPVYHEALSRLNDHLCSHTSGMPSFRLVRATARLRTAQWDIQEAARLLAEEAARRG